MDTSLTDIISNDVSYATGAYQHKTNSKHYNGKKVPKPSWFKRIGLYASLGLASVTGLFGSGCGVIDRYGFHPVCTAIERSRTPEFGKVKEVPAGYKVLETILWILGIKAASSPDKDSHTKYGPFSGGSGHSGSSGN